MDFFFDELPLHSTQKVGCADPQMVKETEPGPSVSRPDIQEENSNSIVNDISRRVQDLVQKVHDRRTSDQKEIEDFQETILEKVTEMCQQMKQDMYIAYEENSGVMEVKLQELTEVLERCSVLQNELMEASSVLANIRENLAIDQPSQPATE
ncbi:synaptonemal complex central element protein 2 [Entelurus aequoreus]|uniref:synaptonemal complex central element protein 2 n=1 Tax=Entelurus aequoreus TaxID=161455 RepID=UPI002B1E548F|nr:synaptonemal complex central element protein 2 [Entelurus aequoreus]XP_061888990.1 synaptonemal complex central element protein 2 [Entelurus aequoreus]